MKERRKEDALVKAVIESGKAIDRLSVNLGKWLGAIALAAASPADNTAEVQAHIDQLTTRINQQTDALSAAIDNAKET